MVIECPHCGTRFRFDGRQLSDSRSMLKCARCRRVFPAPGHTAAARRPKRPPPDDNLSFEFDDDDEWRAPELTSAPVSEDAFLLNEPARDRGAAPAARPRRARPARSAAAQAELRFDDPPEAADTTADTNGDGDGDAELDGEVAVAPHSAPVEEEDDGIGTPDPEEEFTLGEPPARPEPVRGGISVRSVFVFLVVVVGGYGALTAALLDDPDWSRKLTQTLPVIGSTLKEAAVGSEIALVDVQGRYERTKDGKAVFVVTGRAINHSADPLRGVQILASLYDDSNRAVGQQLISCGNALEARIRELSVHQVSILRSIKPPADLGMEPGDGCPFVTIFLDVPNGATTFSTEVVRAQRYA